jgi:hypothetical protein
VAAEELRGIVVAQCKPPAAGIAAVMPSGVMMEVFGCRVARGEDVSAGLAVFSLDGHEEPYIHCPILCKPAPTHDSDKPSF